MTYDFYDYGDIGGEERPRDVKIDEVKEALREFFDKRSGEVFYMKQLEVFFEKRFFHWITGKAIKELTEDELLGSEEVPLQKGTKAIFIFNRRHRYYKRQINERIEVIRQYSYYEIASACGRQAEVLFLHALASRGFEPKGESINEYRGKRWTKTDHNLDWIMERDNVVYGCEVKNTWDYIDRDEFEIKMKMCGFLDLRPLFIMRSSPKSYNYEIINGILYSREEKSYQNVNGGGYAMIFEAQIYPFGQRQLVNKIVDVLELPADCPRAIPEGIIDRFMKWHKRNIL